MLSRGDPLETCTEAFCWWVCKAWGQEKEGREAQVPSLCHIIGVLS